MNSCRTEKGDRGGLVKYLGQAGQSEPAAAIFPSAADFYERAALRAPLVNGRHRHSRMRRTRREGEKFWETFVKINE